MSFKDFYDKDGKISYNQYFSNHPYKIQYYLKTIKRVLMNKHIHMYCHKFYIIFQSYLYINVAIN